jgi:outer membrane protein assembly factor BamB
MTIKIQCPCGAKYSFEVEPVEGRMPFAVHCPTCHAEGTEAANQLIAGAAAKPKLRVQTAATAAAVGEQPPPRPPAPALGSALERLHRERRKFRAAGWIAGAVALVIVALLGAWGWFAFVGSKPRLSYSVKVPGPAASWHTEFLGAGVVLMVSPDHATAHDLNTGKDVWSVSLSEKESGQGARPQTYLDKDSIWICLGARVLRLNRATGEMKQTIPIAGQFRSFTPSDSSLLVVSAKNETTRLACRIDLASGEVSTDEITVPRAEKRAMPNELPPNVQPTAGVLLAQALDEQKFNKPLDAMSSEFFSTGANLVELRVKLLEPKVTFVQTIKPRGPTHINSSLTASSSSADVAEEVFNDIKRDQTGGVKGIDESRYEATIRRWIGAEPVEWKGAVTGVPMFFSLKTVDLLVAGKQLTVFDKQNKKLFSAQLAYAVNGRYQPDRWDRQSVPAVEGNGGLYFFDEGVLTAFSLPSGEVRWRLTSVGISKVQFDDHGVLYVDSTSGSPDDIQYSDQIKLDKAAPVLLKIDPASGKILWHVAQEGQGCFLSGPFLYAASAEQGGIALANGLAEALNAPRPDAPVYFHLYRLDPADGRILWDFYRTEAPAELSFQQNRFLIRFGSEVQVWKFLTF